ncbi:hypothetical protein HQQ94_04425 [Shewanella sp. VB17]|uniref:hypothetical protein n=1 Tax=Shewanella sp. VB17 TaxID=2739432 RepID=UPI0015645BEB|nr:hypothetical protein [Shewanella sp. VB17]NRD72503.1 hypothetical protein [Shewanella sp. VB17]
MFANEVDCRVYPYHPDCRGIIDVVEEGHELLGAGKDQVLGLLADDKAQIISFITTHADSELISTLHSLVFSFGIIG